jgi:uncharacterized protein (UPF0548 family)
LTGSSYTYPEVGSTRGPLPDGYRIVRREAVVGLGREAFEAAAHRLLSWQVHRDAGLLVEAQRGRAEAGTDVRLGLRLGPFSVGAPCRVVYVIDEQDQRGFAYGTLTGHPERGESRFELSLDAGGQIRFRVVSFSAPGTWWSRAGGALTRQVQSRVTDRYVRAAGAGAAGRARGGGDVSP